VSEHTPKILEFGYRNSMYSIPRPTILPKHAPTTSEGMKMPAINVISIHCSCSPPRPFSRDLTTPHLEWNRSGSPGNLIPKVMIVRAPLITNADPTVNMTEAISLGCCTQRLLLESSLHSAKSYVGSAIDSPATLLEMTSWACTHTRDELGAAHSAVRVEKRYHSGEYSHLAKSAEPLIGCSGYLPNRKSGREQTGRSDLPRAPRLWGGVSPKYPLGYASTREC
jgi:hypothetical protein